MSKEVEVWLNNGDHATYKNASRMEDERYDVAIYDERNQLLARIHKGMEPSDLRTVLTKDVP